MSDSDSQGFQDFQDLRALAAERKALRREPERIGIPAIEPCILRVLMVTDDRMGFDERDFSFQELVAALREIELPHVVVKVETAHRRGGAGASIRGPFRFDPDVLASYDELWLMGFEFGDEQRISDAERRAIVDFMDAGKGVFSTGDHEDIGSAMSADLPRIRSMRRWYFPPEITFFRMEVGDVPDRLHGRRVAPPFTGPRRHDTVRLRDGELPNFNDQSDDLAQMIVPLMYQRRPGRDFQPWGYPHPILSGQHGPIRYLPDHPHEGDCHLPDKLDELFTIPASPGVERYKADEYPLDAFGRRVAPEVIAFSDNGPGVDWQFKGPVPEKRYGAIAAYDGQRAGIGRVAVSATWHHFLNLNLRGRARDDEGPWAFGFRATRRGMKYFGEIKAFYSNLLIWLLPDVGHRCVGWRALWNAAWDQSVRMSLRRVDSLEELQVEHLIFAGQGARHLLGDIAGSCQALIWTIDNIPPDLRAVFLGPILPDGPLLGPVDPAIGKRLDKAGSDPISRELAANAVDAALGAMIYRIFLDFDSDEKSVARASGIHDAREYLEPAVRHALGLCAEQAKARIASARAHQKLAAERL